MFSWTTEKVPIRVIDFGNKTDKSRHDRMVSLVDQMLDLHRRQATAKTPSEQTALARQVAATDAQIDRLVYELYGLTEEEVGIVEGVAKKSPEELGWPPGFFERTAGAWQGEPLVREPQGKYEDRDKLP